MASDHPRVGDPLASTPMTILREVTGGLSGSLRIQCARRTSGLFDADCPEDIRELSHGHNRPSTPQTQCPIPGGSGDGFDQGDSAEMETTMLGAPGPYPTSATIPA